MSGFWISLLLFLGSHMAVTQPVIKNFLIRSIGERSYLILYSALSLILLGWLIQEARQAPRVFLWPWVHSLYWVPNIVMPLVFILLVAGFIVPNPLSIASKSEGFNPERPGLIVALTRHPILWSFFLWSSSHLIVNGTYPLALMFAIFSLFSLMGLKLIDKKRKRELGIEKWQKQARHTHSLLFCSKAFWSGQFALTNKDLFGISLGLCLYLIVYRSHVYLFGIDPIPPF